MRLRWAIKRIEFLPAYNTSKRPNLANEVLEDVINKIASHGISALPKLHTMILVSEYAYHKIVAIKAIQTIGDRTSVPVLADFLHKKEERYERLLDARNALESMGSLHDPVVLKGLRAFEETIENVRDEWSVYVESVRFARRVSLSTNKDRDYVQCICTGTVLSSNPSRHQWSLTAYFADVKAWFIELANDASVLKEGRVPLILFVTSIWLRLI